MQIGDSPLAEAARRYFSAENAQTWISLLRPAFHLRAAVGGEPVVGRLGGEPLLPADVEWPVWAGHGPLSFVASVDCGLVPGAELDIPLPASGTLNFFYYDAVGADGVDYLHPDTIVGGTRVIHVPADAEVALRRAPDGLAPFPETLLAGELIATAPDNESAVLVAAYGGDQDDPDAYQDYPTVDDGQGFWDMLTAFRRDHSPHHRIGGYALPKAGNVEKEAAHVVVPGKDAEARAERRRVGSELLLLAQIDSDPRSGMEWGDTGRLYWLIRRADLESGHFDRATFTWQSE